ncbi:S41 family peptidase [Spirillospora sp. NPDC127200]
MFPITGRVLRGAAVAVAVLCAYGAGALGGDHGRRAEGEPGAGRDGSLLDEAADRIGREADRPVSRAELERAAVDGMLRRLGDRWARHYTAGEYDDFQGRLNGRYSGVGLWLSAGEGRDRRIRVASVQPGSAADRAGVRGGDVLLAVGGTAVAGRDVAEIARALRGASGTGVALAVERDRRVHRFRLVRAPVAGGDVTVRDLAGRARLIGVAAFTRGVGRQVRQAVARHPDRRGGVVLDLRGNPGGLLEEAVETASAFLRDGPVVTYQRRGAPPERREVTASGDVGTPLVVLVDAGTASAAEIVAGSLRDRDRAVLVGSPTYGKGSVQEPIRLPDGSAIELTVGRYRTPGGRNLDGVGIDPDVAVSADRPPRAAEQRAQAVLRGLLATLPEKDRG